jgi:hypothetical protein
MTRKLLCAAALCLAAHAQSATTTVTWTGWFSDLQCATNHVSAGNIAPNNPECATTCIKKGCQATSPFHQG